MPVRRTRSGLTVGKGMILFRLMICGFTNQFVFSLHNKSVYVKMGLKKMVSRKTWRDLHKEVRLEVDGRVIALPPVEGIIILNILR